MTSYLLLRNNKESGPYSLAELVQKGLKAYDLVWVNGKSAAWRYPGEIDELQQYAPAVEEQPYDRFYKKPQEEKHFFETAPQPVAVKQTEPIIARPEPVVAKQPEPVVYQKQEPVIAPAAIVNVEPEMPKAVPVPEQPTYPEEKPIADPIRIKSEPVFSTKKSVFVTMPRQRVQPAATTTSDETVNSSYQRYQPQQAVVAPIPEPIPTKTITITENPVTAEIKYSQPLDEIKEMYVKTLQERKKRIANKAFLLQAVKKAAVLIAIVGAGVLIGFSIKSNTVKKMVAAAGSTQPNLAQQPVNSSIVEDEPVNTQENKITEDPVVQQQETQTQKELPVQKKERATLSNEKQESTPIIEPLATMPSKKEIIEPRQEIVLPDPIDQTSPGVEVDSRTGERNRKSRDNGNETSEPVTERASVPETVKDEPAPEPRRTTKENVPAGGLSKLVTVKSNAYKIVAFGGIRDLQLTVLNDSRFLLDKVMVELQYLKPNEEPFRMDMIQFKSVSPGGAMTIRMPDTNRGIKVRYKIVQILSRQAARDAGGL